MRGCEAELDGGLVSVRIDEGRGVGGPQVQGRDPSVIPAGQGARWGRVSRMDDTGGERRETTAREESVSSARKGSVELR